MLYHDPNQADDLAFDVKLAKAKPLDFDSIDLRADHGVGAVPAGYGKLTWSGDFYAMKPVEYLAGSGYEGSGFFKGITSGDQIGWNANASPVALGLGGSFDLGSLEMTAAIDKSLIVDIFGYKNGVEIYHDKVKLNDRHATLVTLDYVNVDEVSFVPGKGVADQRFGPDGGGYIVFDDLAVSHVKGGAMSVSPDFFHGVDHGLMPELMLLP